jgi:copper(I)-binding protein
VSSSLRRGALAASAIAFSIASLAACGAGNDAQSLVIQPDHAAGGAGDIKIQNAILITQPDPEAAGPATVSATVFNSGDKAETLESITVDGSGSVELSPAEGGGQVTVPAGGSIVIGGKDNASAVIADGESLTDGDAHKVTFSFSQTGDVTLEAFIVPGEGYYASWGPSDVPATPSASASPSDGATGEEGTGEEHAGEESASPSATGSGTPTDAASASATESAAEESAGH